MSATVLFLAVIAIVVAWWLSQQRLTAKPWLEEGPVAHLPGQAEPALPAAKVGLVVFLAVVGILFALFTSAYLMRMHMGDWRPLPDPRVLWLNTGVLVVSSYALHRARAAAAGGDIGAVKTGLLAGGASALLFLAGQLWAWQQLAAGGYFLASNPANAFFYLITGVHGLHLAGGLVALGRTTAKAWRGGRAEEVLLSVELCATYWHFLLGVWLVLFALLLAT
ncbi:cytochrome c oxidase subunit 3 [Chelatococcus sp. SYSU_G07232]|uniref:Cytochrome c oxidase subunit 3 n=1 Tax=Chelatococcus albus TaxID=3047466 RepID=A0ABT7ACK0_9HYPH|nr:cytochrome c oxidase subunit 3 [Chelatococcus sp. SYSU_G07232]MDJ1157101.1 cytochrome c oxidase subunit 3 [Chelatococcus sp. SYSU_G07232]